MGNALANRHLYIQIGMSMVTKKGMPRKSKKDVKCLACRGTGISYWTDGVRGTCMECSWEKPIMAVDSDDDCY